MRTVPVTYSKLVHITEIEHSRHLLVPKILNDMRKLFYPVEELDTKISFQKPFLRITLSIPEKD